MTPANPGDFGVVEGQSAIRNTDVLEDIARRVIEADRALPVVNAAGLLVGQVSREHVTRALFQ